MNTIEINRQNQTKPIEVSCQFRNIPEPQVVALVTGVGTGSKLFQSFLDHHEQIYMIPAYPLMYFYPHWQLWKKQFKNKLTWKKAIDLFCEKHASVLDSRNIPGHNGLTTLGEDRKQFIKIDEETFRFFLHHLVKDQPVNSRNFLLAIHFAFALCRGEDISKKRILVYHIHMVEYLMDYLIRDFPDAKVLSMLRDQRSNVERRISSHWHVDDAKLNKTDALLFRRMAYKQILQRILNDMNILRKLDPKNVNVIKHEDLKKNLPRVMEKTAHFLSITYKPCLLDITFGGKKWWGDKIYDMQPINQVNPRVVSLGWQKSLSRRDWFVLEGILYDYFRKYNYEIYKYQNNFFHRRLVYFLIFLPSSFELKIFTKFFLNPAAHFRFLQAALAEAKQPDLLKDYSWNATYLFKWTYAGLKLWRKRWYDSVLQSCTISAKILYVVVKYSIFLICIITWPFLVWQRMKIQLDCYDRCIKHKNYLPELIG